MPGHGSWPQHWITGRRGYFGKLGSPVARSQRENIDPRADVTRRA